MLSVRIARTLVLVTLFAIARSPFFTSLALPPFVTMSAALLAIVLPGIWLAQAVRGIDDSPAAAICWGFAFSLALVSAGSIAFHLTGAFGLGALLALVMVCGYAIALLVPPRAESTPLLARAETWLLVATVAITALVSSPRTGYLTDAYDHLGTVRWMTIEDRAYPVESFHADRAAAGTLDPRKGTYHTTFALASDLTGVDPVDGYRTFWAFTLLLAFASVLTAARAFLTGERAAWIAFILFVVLHRGGPAGEWFSTAGYPGSAGLWLYLLFVSVIVRGRMARMARMPRMALIALGFATLGVHLFYGLLAGLAFLYLFAGLLIFRRAEGAGLVLRGAIAFGAGALPVAIFRYFATYDPANPIHLHRQAVIELTDRLAVLDATPVLQAFGIGGLIALFFLPFLDWRGRDEQGGRGDLFLGTSLAGTFLIVWNPIVFPALEPHLGYLMRRIPYAVPWAFVFAAVMTRTMGPVGTPGRTSISRGRRSIAWAALAVVVITAGWDATRRRPPRAKPAAGVEEIAQQVVADAAKLLPPGTTVLTDPVTGYVLFGRTSLRPVAILDQHSSPNDPLAARRLSESQRALHPATSEAERLDVMNQYETRHILLVTGYPRDFQTYNAFYSPGMASTMDAVLTGRTTFDTIMRTEQAVLYRLDGRESVVPPGDRRPWATAGSLTRPGGPADLPGGIRLTGARLGTSEGRPGDLVWLESEWTLPHEDAGAVPMLLYITGVRLEEGSDPVRTRAERPWKIFSLGGREFPYLLWKKKERIAYDAPLRIPERIAPGRYEVQVTTDRHPFFAVRRLERNGLRWSAARTGWTAVDTVEVMP